MSGVPILLKANCRASVSAPNPFGVHRMEPAGAERDKFCRASVSDARGVNRRFTETPYNFRLHHQKIPCDTATASNAGPSPHAPGSLECSSIFRELILKSEEDDQTRLVAIGTAAENHKAR